MRKSLVPVLVLAAVTLSSGNILPMSHQLQSANHGQQNDNILSNRYNTRNFFNTLFYTVPLGASQSNRPLKKTTKYMNTNNNRAMESFNDIVSDENEDNYDGEGFRKEQWHNYPRQLDRLHEDLLHYHSGNTKRNTDIKDPEIGDYDAEQSKEKILGDMSNENCLDNRNNMYDSVIASTNPFLVLKIHLACLNNRLRITPSRELGLESFQRELSNEKEMNDDIEKLLTNEINPGAKVKREGVSMQEAQNSGEHAAEEKKTVKKRLFSLWSRLQSLSHKGHELPHRRHLAYYGFPEAEGGGGGNTLSSEHSRRAMTLMRPPGSPLRWG